MYPSNHRQTHIMSTYKESGLASLSSNMVAPCEFSTGNDEGDWTVVHSKKTLRKMRKIQQKKDRENANPPKSPQFLFYDSPSASSSDISTVKSGTSWSDVLKRALKIGTTVPQDKESRNEVPPRNIFTKPNSEDDISSVDTNCEEKINSSPNKKHTTKIPAPKHYKKKRNYDTQVQNHPDKRQFEVAFSATHSVHSKTSTQEPNYKKKVKSHPSPDSVIHPNYDKSQDQLHHHKIHEDIMNDCNEHHGKIIHQVQHPEKFPINDEIRENRQNMTDSNYKTYIKKYLPVLNNVQNPVSKRTMIHELHDLTKQAHPDWGDFSRNRSIELKRLEKTVIFNQLTKNNFVHAWKQIYQDVNE